MSADSGLKSAGSWRIRKEDESQKKVIEQWANKHLASRDIVINDLFEDFKDGFALFNLCEILSGEDLKKYGKMSKGKMRIQLIANQNVIFKYMRANPSIRLVFIGPPDVVDGNPTLVLGLMWSLMEFFALHALSANEVERKVLKTRLLHWLMTHTVPPGAVDTPFEINHLAKSLQDGGVLLAVLHHFDPEASAIYSSRTTGDNGNDLNTALDELFNLYGVDKLLDPYSKLEEKYTVPYLLDLVKKMSDKFPDKCKAITDASLDSPPESGALAAAAAQAAADKLELELKESQEAAMNDVALLNVKIKQLEMENAKLTASVNHLEEELEHKSVRSTISPRISTLSPRVSTLPPHNIPKPPVGDAPPVPPVSGSCPPPPPTSAAPAPPPIGTSNPLATVSDDSELLQRIQEMEEAHAIELEETADHFAEVESRHVARADELEAKILELEKEKASDALRHNKVVTELRATLETQRQESLAQLLEAQETASSAKEEKDLMVAKVREQDTERRKLHNLIQELRGNVRVFARIRPFLKQDGDIPEDYEPWLRADPDGSSIHALARVDEDDSSREVSHSFQYDRVFDQKDGQDVVFLEVSEFVQSALDGYNVCLFSYGQTGSGKTHTMTGAPHGDQRGIIPRAIEQVASRKGQLEDAGWSFEMEISFLEIYCEQIRDLLFSGDTADGQPNSKKYKIIANEFGQNIVTNVEMVPVDPADTGSIDELMQHAASLRSVTATKMNAESSRSHSIFTLHLTATHEKQGVTLHGQLNLVDLAGSERIEKSGVSGQALTEAKHINTSLSALSNVFLSLGKKNSHVPFRDSKLTELLHPALSANGKTLMMLNLSPIEASLSESVSSLRFGTSVNSCELGKAKRVIKRKDQGAVTTSKVSTTSKSSATKDKRRQSSEPAAGAGSSSRARSPTRSYGRSNSGEDTTSRAKSPTGRARSPTRWC
jgi:kinesin family protein C1